MQCKERATKNLVCNLGDKQSTFNMSVSFKIVKQFKKFIP